MLLEEIEQKPVGVLDAEQVDMELFRCAIEQRDELAWEQVYQRWRGLLLHWLFRHPLAHLALEQWSSEDYITLTIGKFWKAVTYNNGHAPIFSRRSDILAYLRCCLNSAILDAVQEARSHQNDMCLDDLAERVGNGPPDVDGGEFWRYIEQALPERRERLLVYLRYVRDERPREIAAAYPEEFPSVQEVYRLERNILNRLRRRLEFFQWEM